MALHYIKLGISYPTPWSPWAGSNDRVARQTALMSGAAFIQYKEAVPVRATECASMSHNMWFAKWSQDCCYHHKTRIAGLMGSWDGRDKDLLYITHG